VYDYVDGKVDWMAAGLPVEGEAAPFVTEALADVPTCSPPDRPQQVAERLEEQGEKRAVVVTGDAAVVGVVNVEGLRAGADDATVLDVMHISPATIRPSVALSDLGPDDAGTLVTTSEGVLLGTVDRNAVERLQREAAERAEQVVAEVAEEAAERFGDREPSPDELNQLVQERLEAEGRSAAEAAAISEQLDGGEQAPP
jgi:CBS domain-containing protein